MNFKSGILKLSILIMLVLVLLPVIAAEDSSEAFFIEYSDESDEVVVEESDSIEEVECAQEDMSVSSEISVADEKCEEEVTEEVPADQSVEEIEECSEDVLTYQQDCPVVEAHDVVEEIMDDDVSDLYCENFNDDINHDNVNEFDDCELTIEDNQVDNQGSIFISKHEFCNVDFILVNDLYTGTTSFKTTNSFKRSSFKVLELKNSLLINQNIKLVFVDNFMSNIDGDIIVCTDKTTNDFVFSIDNSVVGDEGHVIFANISYCLKFNPCFDALFCCKFSMLIVLAVIFRDCCGSFL